jgi:hypothetical protein
MKYTSFSSFRLGSAAVSSIQIGKHIWKIGDTIHSIGTKTSLQKEKWSKHLEHNMRQERQKELKAMVRYIMCNGLMHRTHVNERTEQATICSKIRQKLELKNC